MEFSSAKDQVTATLVTRPGLGETVGAGGVYTVTCVGADGVEKWSDTFHNLVVNQGLANMNGAYFAGTAQTTTWYLGLVTGPGSGTTFAAGDILSSHAGWTESTAYAGNRKAVTFGSPTSGSPSGQSAISNSASPSSFVMNATVVIAGAFLASVDTGTSGILFSEGDFTGGDKSVASGDTLNVTYTFTLTAT